MRIVEYCSKFLIQQKIFKNDLILGIGFKFSQELFKAFRVEMIGDLV
jgi:hypothetical protein